MASRCAVLSGRAAATSSMYRGMRASSRPRWWKNASVSSSAWRSTTPRTLAICWRSSSPMPTRRLRRSISCSLRPKFVTTASSVMSSDHGDSSGREKGVSVATLLLQCRGRNDPCFGRPTIGARTLASCSTREQQVVCAGATGKHLSFAHGNRTIRARMNPRIWRTGHRWLGFLAAVFLLFAGTTGVLVAATEFFGEAEAERERLRDVVSSVTTDSPLAAWTEPLQRALATVAHKAPRAPVDRVELKLKGDRPTVAVCTGLPAGGEDRRYVLDARTGELL